MKNILALSLSIICLISWAVEPISSAWLAYSRSEIEQLQLWRFLTANLVHLGLWHTLLNLASLWFITTIFKSLTSSKDWLIWVTILFIANIIGIHYFVDRIDHYVGMSGALYGLIAVACVAETRLGEKLSAALLVIVGLKIFAPHILGITSEYDEWLGGSVVEESHLVGYIQGLILGLVWPKNRLQSPSFSALLSDKTSKSTK